MSKDFWWLSDKRGLKEEELRGRRQRKAMRKMNGGRVGGGVGSWGGDLNKRWWWCGYISLVNWFWDVEEECLSYPLPALHPQLSSSVGPRATVLHWLLPSLQLYHHMWRMLSWLQVEPRSYPVRGLQHRQLHLLPDCQSVRNLRCRVQSLHWREVLHPLQLN